ncbi:hypothetical protein DRO61_04885 [Candidatus Bathyarchaeota archaeon]|nr:MAG: hypothetical protein DRO61_04885 [Candidatus Bathyarchaeota archaeon]
MESFEVRRDSNGQAYEVTIEKNKTFWMKLFKIPCKITYGLRDNNWYNETYDRLAKFSESNEIDWRISQMELSRSERESLKEEVIFEEYLKDKINNYGRYR